VPQLHLLDLLSQVFYITDIVYILFMITFLDILNSVFLCI